MSDGMFFVVMVVYSAFLGPPFWNYGVTIISFGTKPNIDNLYKINMLITT
jgi:hypothetical protein